MDSVKKKIVGKGENAGQWLPSFSPFPAIFFTLSMTNLIINPFSNDKF